MRTIRPPAHDLSFTVELLNVSYQGHVIFTGHDKASHSLHVFTLNGRHLVSKLAIQEIRTHENIGR